MTPSKINIAELLMDCPKGMELYSTIYGRVYFEEVRDTGNAVLINVKTVCNTDVFFYPDGKFNTYYTDSEMSLFPSKDVRTWEGFVPPRNFKDGDILVGKSGYPFIFKSLNNSNGCCSYCGIDVFKNFKLDSDDWTFANSLRFATEEEKEKLFDAIKENGYRWNAETKTLEKLPVPQFKVGDRVKSVFNNSHYDITELTNTHYTLVEVKNKFIYTESIIEDKNWELVPHKFDINTLKPFESRVLVRNTGEDIWKPAIFGCYLKDKSAPYYALGGTCWRYCIPFEGNEHLLGTTDDCDEFCKNWK